MQTDGKSRILELRKQINRHDYLYNVLDESEISDADYDKLYRELEKLENECPEYYDLNSPTQRIGAKLLDGFVKVEHIVQMQSLQDVFSDEELVGFLKRIEENIEEKVDYIVERKIDGLSP